MGGRWAATGGELWCHLSREVDDAGGGETVRIRVRFQGV